MNEGEIRKEIESRKIKIDAAENWWTPGGRQRTVPMYEAEIRNIYLQKVKFVKAKSMHELRTKCNAAIGTWNEQEIRKRVVDGKRQSKEKAKLEAERLDREAKSQEKSFKTILQNTLAIDDRIDWTAERDTQEYSQFSYPEPPQKPKFKELHLTPKPGWTWLFPSRLKRWKEECLLDSQEHAKNEADAQAKWEKTVADHRALESKARDEHAGKKREFLAKRDKFNHGLEEFQRKFESGDIPSVIEYCSNVLERSQYPEPIVLKNEVGFDQETGSVIIDIELPSEDLIPSTSGYKFVASGNKVVPITMKAKDSKVLYQSIIDQILVRTIHEILEGCYIEKVEGVLLNGWVTNLDKSTGNDHRERVCSIIADRKTFETFDLARVEPAACIKRLSEGTSQMYGVEK